MNIMNPPSYCPDAIPTNAGWVNPKTGELLVSHRNLLKQIEEFYAVATEPDIHAIPSDPIPVVETIKIDVPTVIMSESVEDVPEPVQDSVTQTVEGNSITLEVKESTVVEESFPPTKKRAGRPKKS